jgi:hypothetical protein
MKNGIFVNFTLYKEMFFCLPRSYGQLYLQKKDYRFSIKIFLGDQLYKSCDKKQCVSIIRVYVGYNHKFIMYIN